MEMVLAFVAGCCVGIAPWHWLAKKNERLAREIHIAMWELEVRKAQP